MCGQFAVESYKHSRFVVNTSICGIIDGSICSNHKRYRFILETYKTVVCCIYVVDVTVAVWINGILYLMGFFTLTNKILQTILLFCA